MAAEYNFKLVLVGDAAVGKSQILLRFAKNQFSSGSKATIGMEMCQKILKLDTPDQQYVRAQVWDTCGQERFKSISGLYFKAAVGALLVYDITNRDSFENVQKWMAQIKDKADPNIVMMLVGNKSDLNELRQVKMDEAMRFAETNCKFGITLIILFRTCLHRNQCLKCF